MPEFNIIISSPEVTELIVAKVSKGFYEYWKDKTLDEKADACNDIDDELDIPEEFRLSNWNGMNSIVHICAPDPTESNITVTNEDFDEVYNNWCGDFEQLTCGPELPDFFVKDLPDDTYIMKIHRESDGDWFTGTLDAEEFDADKLQLSVVRVETADMEYGEPGMYIGYIQGVQYRDGDNQIVVENTDDTYQDIRGFTRIDFISVDEYKAWEREFEE